MIAGLEARLQALAAAGETVSYGALARDLGLTGPGTIARLTADLEALMEMDAAAGKPLRAALCHARFSTLPAPGFFTKASALGLDAADAVALTTTHRAALFGMSG